MLRPKKNSCKEFDNEKKFLQLENSPPPHNFSNGPSLKYLMFKHIHKPTETFQYTHFSSCHPPSVKKGFVKGEALCLLRTNSVKESFELKKKEFITRVIIRTRLRLGTHRNNPSQSSFRITQNGFTQ